MRHSRKGPLLWLLALLALVCILVQVIPSLHLFSSNETLGFKDIASARHVASLLEQGDGLIGPTSKLLSSSNYNMNATSLVRTSKPKVLFFLSLTGCNPKFANQVGLWDALAVWKFALEQTQNHARYNITLGVVVAPSWRNSSCMEMMESLNYKVYERPIPVTLTEIAQHHPTFAQRVKTDGCCGLSELLKLYAYSFTEYDVVVSLDLDTLVLRPLDVALDALAFGPASLQGRTARQALIDQHLLAPTYRPRATLERWRIHALYTKDYNILPRKHARRPGMQGGMLMVKPNASRFVELVDMMRAPNYTMGTKASSGWYKSGYGGHIWGSMTIQGLLGYYYARRQLATSVELHRCQWNQIGDNPRRTSFDPKYARGSPIPGNPNNNATWKDLDCRDGRKNCDDVQCQTWPLNQTYIVHFTYCPKVPWKCPLIRQGISLEAVACQAMHSAWHEWRDRLQPTGNASGGMEGTFGNCYSAGSKGYLPIQNREELVANWPSYS